MLALMRKQPAGAFRGIRKWMLMTGGFVAGMFLAYACSSSSKPPRRLVYKLGSELRRLRDRILGRNQVSIRRVMGPPRSAVTSVAEQLQPPTRIENAETWYYPLDADRAMAIQFVGGTARRVEFLSTAR
jgi:hypothetical protein